MATKKRDIPLGKEKAKSTTQTPAMKLKATPNGPTKSSVSTAPQKQLQSSVRPTTRTMSTNVSKPQVKKTASTGTANRPTNPKPKPIDKTLSPIQKTRVSPNASPRSSLSGKIASPRLSLSGKIASPRPSLSGKIADSQKSVSGKTLNSPKLVPSKVMKTPAKEVGKQLTSHATPVSNVKLDNTSMKKRESGSGLLAKKEQIACVPHEKIENLSIHTVPKAETQVQDQEQETCLTKVEEREAQIEVKSSNDQGSSSFEEKIEAEIDRVDAKTETSETPSTLEREDAPLDTKRQEEEDSEEQSKNETSSCNKGEDCSITDNLPHEDAKQEEVEEVAKEETTLTKKNDAVERVDEIKEREVETKQETIKAAPKQVERVHGKKESAVSNDVIEETASKLREQRKNKVRALAGAFETVISLQEAK